MQTPIRIGTRGSPLALVQANMVGAALRQAHGLAADDIAIVTVKTTGDKVQDRPLAEIGGKALWTKELDRALAEDEVDCCVHSMKDVETIRPAAIQLAATLPRADVRDRLIGAGGIDVLKQGARIGTSSPRRAAQLLNLRPDLDIDTLRGNVATRLAAVEAGRFDATLLAAAGLDRLGHGEVGRAIEPETMLPAPQQGAIGVEILAERAELTEIIAAIDDAETHCCIAAERALLDRLGADCQSPVAALARIAGEEMVIAAQLLTNDGRDSVSDERRCAIDQGEWAARELAGALLDEAAQPIRKLFAGAAA